MKYFITIDNDNKITSWCECSHDRPKETEVSPDAYASLVYSDEYYYTYVEGTVAKVTLKDSDLAALHIPEALRQLSVITTSRIFNGTVDFNGAAVRTTALAYKNFHELTSLHTSGLLDEEMRLEAANHMKNPALTGDHFSQISKLLGKHKLTCITAHDIAEEAIKTAENVAEIEEVLANY